MSPSPIVEINAKSPLRVLEFFSGIGGLHYGLELAVASHNTHEICLLSAFDVNTHANAVYKHNFGQAPNTLGIQYLTPEMLDRYNADMWLLSPPCQPFTAGGKRLDHEDSRSTALLHLIDVLPRLTRLPCTLFLENVPNFELSICRDLLLGALAKLGYEVHEFLVSPLGAGLPNDRKRYYLTAKRVPSTNVPVVQMHHSFLSRGAASYQNEAEVMIEPISVFLDSPETMGDEYQVPHSYLTHHHDFRFDIVTPAAKTSAVMTKAYGSKHYRGSGSLLQTANLNLSTSPHLRTGDVDVLLGLGLRFFTPTEVARLHGFPIDDEASIRAPGNAQLGLLGITQKRHGFSFPKELTRIQRYRLLGNSLNVHVVAKLLNDLLYGYDL